MIGASGYGAAAQLVGGIIQAMGAQKAQKAMGKEFDREQTQQNRYRNEAFGIYQPGLEGRGVETARTQIADGAEKRQGFFQEVGETKFGGQGGPSGRDKAAYTLSGQNRANNGGYSEYAIDQMISNIRTQDQLNRVSNFAGGDARVFPFKMQDAQHAGDELAMWGQIISSLGGSGANFASMMQAPPSQQGGGVFGGGGGHKGGDSGTFGGSTDFTDQYRAQR